jgi:phosphatidylethanolamine/phosphatidyl-N-methylethanolamine N-methyltransferase
MERFRFASWRTRLRDRIVGNHALEVGIGTGSNLPYHPQDTKIIAIDISFPMLKRAKKQTASLNREAYLMQTDVRQDITFCNN